MWFLVYLKQLLTINNWTIDNESFIQDHHFLAKLQNYCSYFNKNLYDLKAQHVTQ